MIHTATTSDSMEGEAFWGFCLALYARSEVEAACLDLQDNHNLDVMIVLFCLYAGRHGQRIDSDTVTEAVSISRHWGAEIVKPMRMVRRKLKTPPSGVDPHDAYRLRTRLQALEQDAERIQHEQLARLLKTGGLASRAAAKANLNAYAEKCGMAAPASFETLLKAAFPGAA